MTRIKDFIPGAEPRCTPPDPEPHADDDMLGRPVLTDTGGTAYYPISALAAALNRTNGTMRAWEHDKVIPPGYIINPGSRNGRRRLYTRKQILRLRELAAECGILDDPRAVVKASEFSRLAWLLFDAIREGRL